MSLSRVHFADSYYVVRKLGEGAFGESHIAISKADAYQICSSRCTGDQGDLYNALRAKLVAVKFAKAEQPFRYGKLPDLSGEICTTANIAPAGHRSIIKYLNHCNRGTIQWLATQYMSGGDLNSFMVNHPEAVTLPFAWHVGFRVAEALAFLFFGAMQANGMKPRADWNAVFHRDIHAGNILLGPVNGRDVSHLPDVVLADFGEASISPCSLKKAKDQDDVNSYIADIESFTDVLSELLHIAAKQETQTDSLLFEWIMRLNLHREVRRDQVIKEHLLALLKDFMLVADCERRKPLQTMTPGVEAALSLAKVSDAELEMIVCRSTSHVVPESPRWFG